MRSVREGETRFDIEPKDLGLSETSTSDPPSPSQQIRRIIGTAIVDEAEALHNEVMLLLEIWRDYRAETNEREGTL